MKRILLLAFAALVFAAPPAFAQQQGTLTLSWTNPTTTVNGAPLTGVNALTKYQIFISEVSVPATGGPPPTLELNATAPLQTTYVHPAQYGKTYFVRMTACNSGGCSVRTGEVSGTVPWPPGVPGAPQNVTITLSLGP